MSDTIPPTTIEEAPARRLVRVDEGRWLGGVAAGLGRYFDVNPLVYRIAFIALAFAGGTGILLYLAAWLVIPAQGSEDSTAVQALREHRERPWLLLGVGLLLLSAVLVLSESDFWALGNLWLAALLGGVALLWWHLAHREEQPVRPATPVREEVPPEAAVSQPPPPPRTPRRPSLTLPVLGALFAVAGVFGLLAVLDVYEIDLDLVLAVAVAIVGVAIAAGAFLGYRVGALVPLGLLLLCGFAGAALLPVSISSGIGDKTEQPVDAAALQQSYEFGMGDYELDLASLELADGTTPVDVSLGVGSLRVTVPHDVAIDVDAHAGAGEVIVLGSSDDGIGADREIHVPGPKPDSPTLALDANVGFGQIEILRG